MPGAGNKLDCATGVGVKVGNKEGGGVGVARDRPHAAATAAVKLLAAVARKALRLKGPPETRSWALASGALFVSVTDRSESEC